MFKNFIKNHQVDSYDKNSNPTELNGMKFSSWKPPVDNEWNYVSGQNHEINEPPLPKTSKKIATGLLMHEPDGRVWIVKPTNEFGGYKHTFPKGKLEPNLHPQANAIKETFEESGLKGKITGFAGDHEGDTSLTRYYHAVREGGTPKDHGWESEKVLAVHPSILHKYLNRTRDQKISNQHLGGNEPIGDW
jgi:ADP-ribose pyrophosphatase YjhB (NUDIX family)